MFDTGVIDTGVVVGSLVARARELSQLQAALLADLVAVFDATPKPEFAAFEISAALTWTRRAAEVQLDLAHMIVRQFPLLHTAMTAGDVDLPKARVIVDGVAALDLGPARSIVATILPQAPALTTGELRVRLAKLVIATDPAAAVKRHKARKKQRRVELQNTEDSCAALLGLNLPADDALAASNRLTAFARALKQAGDPRSIDQLRADTFLNLLLGNTCSHHTPPSHHHSSSSSTSGSPASFSLASGSSVSGSSVSGSSVSGSPANGSSASGSPANGNSAGVGSTGGGSTGGGSTGGGSTGGGSTGGGSTGGESAGGESAGGESAVDGLTGSSCSCGGSSRHRGGVELTGDLATLAGLAQRPGDLGGYGAVIAEIARRVAEQQRRSPWTFTIRDPATGQIFTGPVRRRPTAAMARHIRARDRTCRAPGCRRIGIYADIDHTIAVEHGWAHGAGQPRAAVPLPPPSKARRLVAASPNQTWSVRLAQPTRPPLRRLPRRTLTPAPPIAGSLNHQRQHRFTDSRLDVAQVLGFLAVLAVAWIFRSQVGVPSLWRVDCLLPVGSWIVGACAADLIYRAWRRRASKRPQQEQ